MRQSRSVLLKSSLMLMVAGTLITLPGCMKVGPDYVPPVAQDELEIEVKAGEYLGILPEQVDIANWWQVFADPLLSALVAEAVANNHDLRVAISRVTEARLQLGITSADYLPTVDGSGSANRAKIAVEQ